MTASRATCENGHRYLRCRSCEILFEEGLADPGPGGEPRCPQCGLWDTEPTLVSDDEFAVRHGTRFR